MSAHRNSDKSDEILQFLVHAGKRDFDFCGSETAISVKNGARCCGQSIRRRRPAGPARGIGCESGPESFDRQ